MGKRKWTHRDSLRPYLVFSAFLLGAAVLAAHLCFLQFDDDHVQRIAKVMEDRWSSYEVLSGKRGNILFRDGSLLAGNQKVARVLVDPHLVSDPDALVAELAPRLSLDPLKLVQKIKSHKGNGVVIAEAVPTDAALEIDKLGLSGVVTRYHYLRYYPYGDFGAAPTVGYANCKSKLSTGLECYFDEQLTGKDGRADFLKDASRHRLPGSVEEVSPPVNGADLTTTLDPEVQVICEKELRAAVEQRKPDWGCIVVMEPNSGEVLGAATYPYYDPNKYVRGEIEHEFNPLVSNVFEPGSTAKPVLAAYALDRGWLDPEKKYVCWHPLQIGRYPITEAEANHYIGDGNGVSIFEIIKSSSNVGMAQIALELGQPRVTQAYSAMGFFARTGIELPAESCGMVPCHDEQQKQQEPVKWPRITLANSGFGQGLAVTPLQLATAYCIIANGGYRVVPTLVLEHGSTGEAAQDQPALPPNEALLAGFSEQEEIITAESVQDEGSGRVRVLSGAACEQVQAWLTAVVEDGTGRQADFALHQAAGKTGTGQIPSPNGGYEANARSAVFAGFWPAAEPRYVTLVLLVHPRGGEYYGGAVAAPIFRRVAEQISRCDRPVYSGESNAT